MARVLVLAAVSVAAAVLGALSWPNNRWVVALALAILWATWGAVWMERRAGVAARAEAERRSLERSRSTASLPAEAEDFLATLDTRLELPAEVRTEIRDELSGHLEDSISALETEGLDRDRATREALARLGRPEELARQIRAAHQTTRRLLAGAGGGVFAAGTGVIEGYVFGILIFLMAVFAVGGILAAANLLANSLLHQQFSMIGVPSASAGAAMLAWVPAFVAGRGAARASARTSQRNVRQTGTFWAIAGFAVIGYVVMFRVTALQDWLVAVAEMTIPVSFAAGAVLKTESEWPRLGGWTKFAMLSMVVVLSALLGLVAGSWSVSTTSGGSWQDPGTEDASYDRVAPAWPSLLVDGNDGNAYQPTIDLTWHVGHPSALAAFSGLRFEVWRAIRFPEAPDWVDAYVPDPGYSAPVATQATSPSETLESSFDMSHSKWTQWLVFLTGVGPDGIRYRLARPLSAPTVFSGTVWDWISAGN